MAEIKVRYKGCTDGQATMGRGMDPRPLLEEGEVYTLVSEHIHSWHTLYFLEGFLRTPFNSVCFEKIKESDDG
ncbi:hypothetical protein LCGC14_2848920 [marine sediment metagenome]|uniref:Uncharacterized protein n=1 Tax=marine sediment metagenome TaxID=412755 RepID=A0A0F8YVT6_9ZZZZ